MKTLINLILSKLFSYNEPRPPSTNIFLLDDTTNHSTMSNGEVIKAFLRNY